MHLKYMELLNEIYRMHEKYGSNGNGINLSQICALDLFLSLKEKHNLKKSQWIIVRFVALLVIGKAAFRIAFSYFH